jgi:hypothetical protein
LRKDFLTSVFGFAEVAMTVPEFANSPLAGIFFVQQQATRANRSDGTLGLIKRCRGRERSGGTKSDRSSADFVSIEAIIVLVLNIDRR